MSDQIQLPVPDAAALEHSARVNRFIRRRIAEAGGWIDFSEYMQMALYAPGLGYYSAGAHKFGESGDFVTAPEVSPLFSSCLARAFIDLSYGSDSLPGPPTILELGAGSGVMAVEILQTLQRLNALPERYLILEVSADLRERQRRFIAERVADLAERVVWLDELPAAPITGVIVANEVLDAQPVTRFVVDADNRICILGVEASGSGFGWGRRPAEAALHKQLLEIADDLDVVWPPGYASEWSPVIDGFMAGLSQSLERGLIMLIDYGLPMKAFYSPERASGTLVCHYRHRMHTDPFFYPGLQDITAWIDFTRVANAAAVADLDVLGFTTQAQFLLGGGVEEEFALLTESSGAAQDPREQIRIAAGLKTLMMPGQMGENFKVMALGRQLPQGPASVCANDLLHLL
ncbi:MAG: SAM-dependent methyltransferase [Gammaproteobacteria bacterium]|jgi:SAM-dependent MidA family methyltransferase|nr:SAM-dependent methyltransferase [Chromatiales bacterium]MCP4925273.1 SAM-dependent methyltransferase [Gammaproteobacteria bacterium]MDP7093921.1 SAM-dependent methyltransferase [Gammaproteobacteria bacterium]MDP7296260.1 SAM-dependent methyltransferase [Gammaproteobacteria bacterium]MDP7419005.1 SAM-dependent methyltransferase [Gammaproteobacteria bacterium]